MKRRKRETEKVSQWEERARKERGRKHQVILALPAVSWINLGPQPRLSEAAALALVSMGVSSVHISFP